MYLIYYCIIYNGIVIELCVIVPTDSSIIMDSELSDAVLLRAEIEVNLHQLEHLQRSQHELNAALREAPNDEDFIQAFNENTLVISTKINKLRILKRQLEAIDVSFQREQRFLDRLNSAMTSIGNLAITDLNQSTVTDITPITLSETEPASISAHVYITANQVVSEEGIYL